MHINDRALIEGYLTKRKNLVKQYLIKFGADAIINRLMEKKVIADAEDFYKFITNEKEIQDDLFGFEETDYNYYEQKND
jgi:hypothetical protein